MESIPNNILAVDVSKKKLDTFCLLTKHKKQFTNTQSGIQKLIQWAIRQKVHQIVCEASGGYETTLVHIVNKHDRLSMKVVNARRVRQFAQALGKEAKNDSIDAEVIALFADTCKFKPQSKSITESHLKLRELVKRKEELTEMIAKEKTRMKNPRYYYTRNVSEEIIEMLQQKRSLIKQEIDTIISNEQNFAEKKRIMETFSGVGPETSSVLLAEMPEIGTISGKQIASLLGVAPFVKESGQYKGVAYTRYGRFIPRRVVYMAALSAAFHNDFLSKFYQKLIARGKAAKVALIAVARKIIVILNAMIRDNVVWKG